VDAASAAVGVRVAVLEPASYENAAATVVVPLSNETVADVTVDAFMASLKATRTVDDVATLVAPDAGVREEIVGEVVSPAGVPGTV
jgi:hypothetical protein